MKQIIECEVCKKPAEFTLQPEGGRISYWCKYHFDKVIENFEVSEEKNQNERR